MGRKLRPGFFFDATRGAVVGVKQFLFWGLDRKLLSGRVEVK
jgi:hypothetical protein